MKFQETYPDGELTDEPKTKTLADKSELALAATILETMCDLGKPSTTMMEGDYHSIDDVRAVMKPRVPLERPVSATIEHVAQHALRFMYVGENGFEYPEHTVSPFQGAVAARPGKIENPLRRRWEHDSAYLPDTTKYFLGVTEGEAQLRAIADLYQAIRDASTAAGNSYTRYQDMLYVDVPHDFLEAEINDGATLAELGAITSLRREYWSTDATRPWLSANRMLGHEGTGRDRRSLGILNIIGHFSFIADETGVETVVWDSPNNGFAILSGFEDEMEVVDDPVGFITPFAMIAESFKANRETILHARALHAIAKSHQK